MCAGIDVDIDVEHEGQRTKVTKTPSQGGDVEEDMEVAGTNNEGRASSEGVTNDGGGANSEGVANGGGRASSEGRTCEGSKVS